MFGRTTENMILLMMVTSLLSFLCIYCEDVCYNNNNCQEFGKTRYLLYDVNPPEGFNLRRDVYMRFAILAHKLSKSKNKWLNIFKLVLPPWSHLYHWKYQQQPEHIPWSLYFDIQSLKSFAPVIDMHEFFSEISMKYGVSIDELYIFEHFKEMFETGNFEEKMLIQNCKSNEEVPYFFYNNFTAKSRKCLLYHGSTKHLTKFLNDSKANLLLFHHAEIPFHDMYGDKIYWQCRRSMRFNKALRDIAADFRLNYLNSTDALDKTILPDQWQNEKAQRNAVGGPYLGVHIRRKDFFRGRSAQMPSVDNIVIQIVQHLKRLNLKQVFVATDTTDEEYNEILRKLPSDYKALTFKAENIVRTKFGDGGIAIIEQIICSHARYFIGTYESTFSLRIEEEREIFGFPFESSFNSFCKNNETCPQPSIWKIVF